MNSIEAIIVSSSNETRKTMAISLEAASNLIDNNEGYAFFCIKEASNDHGTTTSLTRYSCSTSSPKRLRPWQQQLIATRTQNSATTANSPLMWTNHINNCKGARCQQCDWSWCLNDNVNNATIISYCHIVRSYDNNRQMQGKIKQTPTQQSKFHVVVCKTGRRPYHSMQESAAQIRQGQVQRLHQRRHASTPKTACTSPQSSTLPKASILSMPKMACTLPIASTVSMPYSVYIAKDEYGKYVKGGCIRQGGKKRASRQRRWWWTPCQGWRLAEYNNMSPLPQRQLAAYIMWGSNKHLDTRTGDCVHCARRRRAPLGLCMHARQPRAPH